MARVKLRVILVVLSFLSFLSVSVAGYVYFRSLQDSAYKEAEKDSALQAERIRNGVSSFLAENLKTARALAGLQEMRGVLSDPRGPSLARANAVLDHFRSALAADVCYLMDRGRDDRRVQQPGRPATVSSGTISPSVRTGSRRSAGPRPPTWRRG